MTYAYDDWVQMPVKDLYNTAIMKMAIDAAKDMYDKSQDQMENFYKTYGDFMSPFAKDMDKYGRYMTGIRDTINDAYARGIDLFKSPEGRMLVQQLSHVVDPGWYNKAKANAKVGYEYMKAVQEARAKNQFNPDFEKYAGELDGLGNFEDFSTDSGKMWTRSAPYQYQDLNQYTGHIFDKMEDSFIETGEDHYDYYGVSREQRAKALTDNLAGILSTPLGKYHYEKAREHAAMLGKDYNDENVVMQQFQDDVLTSTTEYEHRNRKLNEMWKLQYEDRSRQRAAARSSSSNTSPSKSAVAYDSAEGLFYRGLIKAGGTEHYSDVERAVEDGRDNIVRRQIDLLKKTQAMKYNAGQATNYILNNLSIQEAPSNFARYAQIQTDSDGTFVIDNDTAERLYSDESIVSHMYGLIYKTNTGKWRRKYTDRKGLVGKIGFPKRKVTTGFVQNANGDYSVRQFWEIEVGSVDGEGKFNLEKVMRYELPTSRAVTHNVPDYTKYKRMNDQDKDVIIRPSIKEDPNTLGWKNTGSMQVNAFEHTPSPMGFWGTSNNEAFEER